jgi:hypothetical protein
VLRPHLMPLMIEAQMPEPERMKSFRIYTQEPVSAPDRRAPDIPSEERQRYREEFKGTAHWYRRYGKIIRLSFVLVFVVFGTACFLPRYVAWLIPLAVIALILLMVLRPALVCPACKNNLEIIAHFCPQCGAPALKPATRWTGEQCTGCGREMRTSSRGQRRYPIRACSHCGIWLDDVGV